MWYYIIGENMNNRKKLILTIFLVISLLAITAFFGIYYKMLEDYNNSFFELKGDQEITVEIGKTYKEPGYIAVVGKKDKTTDVKINSNVNTNSLGNYEIKYTLNFEKINKQKQLTRKVSIVDKTKPTLTVEGKKEITKQVGDTFTTPKYKAIDNADGNITSKVKINSNVDMNKAGTYKVSYTVADNSGNKVTKTIKVIVKEKPKPKEEPKKTTETKTSKTTTKKTTKKTTKVKKEKTSYKGTFVEISIKNQTLKYYKNNKLALKTSVVTGKNNATPRGSFKVVSKARKINLIGEDYVSFVYYWIAFKGRAYGIHDATWRSSFGGQIYKKNGSHGCVNIPYKKAQKLYSMITVGTPVYIY